MNAEQRINKMLDLKQAEVSRSKILATSDPDGTRSRSYQNEIDTLKLELGMTADATAAANVKYTKTTRASKAAIELARDQAMGANMFGMLAPSGVKLATGAQLKRGETRITDSSEIVVSKKAGWYDNVVGVERAKHAPTIKVVYDHLGQEMGEVWKAIEEASAAYRQSHWTHNPQLLKTMKRELKKRPVTDLSQALTNAAMGLPVPPLSEVDKYELEQARRLGDTAQVMAATRQQWVLAHADEVEAAVQLASEAPEADKLEELFNIAYWIGCELDMIDDQVDSPDSTGDGADSEGESGENPDSDLQQGDGGSDDGDSDDGDSDDSESDSGSDSGNPDSQDEDEGSEGEGTEGKGSGEGTEGEDSQDSSGADDGTGDQSTDESADESTEAADSSSGKKGSLGSGSDTDKGKQALEAMQSAVAGDDEIKNDASDSFNAVHPDERWGLLDGKTFPVKSHTHVALAMEDFVGNDDFKESHFGDPDPDMLHELRMGNMDVFEVEADTQGKVMVAVDCSTSMGCWCDEGLHKNQTKWKHDIEGNLIPASGKNSKAGYATQTGDTAENGWLAWQVATAIHKQFTDSVVFGYSGGYIDPDQRDQGYNGTVNLIAKSPDWDNPVDLDPLYKEGGRYSHITSGSGTQLATRIVEIRKAGEVPVCRHHPNNQRSLLKGGTPEAGGLSYLTHKLKAEFETSVGILITDGEPNNTARSYAMTRRMHKAGMRFGVIQINHPDTGLYPASMLHHINKPEDLKKLSAIFDFIAGGNK